MDFDFSGIPEITEEVKRQMQTKFKNYLFFETVKRGMRDYTCTACHQSFSEGAKVLHRTMTSADYNLQRAAHNEECVCPLCGARGTVKNVKRCSVERLNEGFYFAIFLPASANEIYIRCVSNRRSYDKSLSGETDIYECMRYYLAPGEAMHFDKCWRSDWIRKVNCGEAFVWTHGHYTEKYAYDMICGNDMTLNDTFLKYCSFEKYEGKRRYNNPLMKYLCWYAKHPQLEMIVKLGMYEIVDEMIFKNAENKRILDWNAKTPWELCRLTKTEFNAWRKINSHTGGDINVLKIYKAIKNRTIKDFELANRIASSAGFKNYNTLNLKKARAFVVDCNRFKVSPREVYRYLEKVQKNSAGHCHHCPGISIFEVFDLWGDYISMARGLGSLKNVNPMPADLKGEHDALVKRIGYKRRADSVAACRENAKKETPAYSRKYPKVAKVLKKIKKLYEYRGENYSVIVPSGVEDIIFEGNVLNHCIGKGKSERYFDRIGSHESYILFLRSNTAPEAPWYTLEVEPGGTIRQKRTEGDRQDPDLEAAKDFLAEWQEVVRLRIGENEKTLAKASAEKRRHDYTELRENGIKIHYGVYAGQLLADVLEKDLMEMPLKNKAEERNAG